MIAIGIDPGLAETGIVVLRPSPRGRWEFVTGRTIRTKTKWELSNRLLEIGENVYQVATSRKCGAGPIRKHAAIENFMPFKGMRGAMFARQAVEMGVVIGVCTAALHRANIYNIQFVSSGRWHQILHLGTSKTSKTAAAEWIAATVDKMPLRSSEHLRDAACIAQVAGGGG